MVEALEANISIVVVGGTYGQPVGAKLINRKSKWEMRLFLNCCRGVVCKYPIN